MTQAWLYSLISVIGVSLISLIGVISLLISSKALERLLLFLVSFSAGVLLGDAFLHLIPEAFEILNSPLMASGSLLGGVIVFFVLEKVICWRHCHVPTSIDHPHPVAWMNLVGDGLHNFIDGLIITSSYLISLPLGLGTTLAVIAHEIPQEIGDFGVLIYGGFSRLKALFLNLLSGLLALGGVIIAFFISHQSSLFSASLVPFAAGGFIYIALSDLVPELHKETKPSKSLGQLVFLLAGVGIMLALLILE